MLKSTRKTCTDNVYVLTDAGEQIIEPLFGEKRVLQTTEIQFEDTSYWVDVMVVIIIGQWVVSWDMDIFSSVQKAIRHENI